MLCGNCSNRVYLDNNFCGLSGEKVKIQEFAIRYYFTEGFQYKAILELLRKYHGIEDIEISMRTFKRSCKYVFYSSPILKMVILHEIVLVVPARFTANNRFSYCKNFGQGAE